MSIILSGDNGVTFNDSSLQGAAASPYGLKNRIINGDMRIDQRNAGAAITPTVDPTYTVDRFFYSSSQASKFTWQQNRNSVTLPSGYTNYLGGSVAATATVGAGDYFLLGQAIEGYNTADLAWGTANAKTITLSFLVYSNTTGTFGGSLSNSAQNRSYPFTYTISSANTWTQISVTIAGDTSGTWTTTNGIGIRVWWSLGTGTTYSGTANTWAATNYVSATGATSLMASTSNIFYITGVQLEVGSTATPFERRMYGQELLLCQRYYEKSYNINAAPATAQNEGQRVSAGNTGTTTTGEITVSCEFNTRKRTAPTMVMYDAVGNSGKCTRTNIGVANYDNSAIDVVLISETNAYVYSNTGSAACFIRYHFTASAEL